MPIAEAPAISGVDSVREGTRKIMAYIALGGFMGVITVIIVGGWMYLNREMDDVIKVLTTTAGVLSGVVGAVVGFYFRGEDK